MHQNKNNPAISISIMAYVIISLVFFAIIHSEWVGTVTPSDKFNQDILFPGLADDITPHVVFNHLIK